MYKFNELCGIMIMPLPLPKIPSPPQNNYAMTLSFPLLSNKQASKRLRQDLGKA